MSDRNTVPFIEFIDDAPLWMQERANRLHKLCKTVERLVLEGKPISKSVACVCKRTSLIGRSYDAAPGKVFQVSPVTLRNHFSHWRKNGKEAAVFLPRYRVVKSPISEEFVMQAMIRMLEKPSCVWVFSDFQADLKAGLSVPYCSRGELCRHSLSFSLRTFRRHIPASFLKKLRRLQQLKSEMELEICNFAESVGNKPRVDEGTKLRMQQILEAFKYR